METEIKSKLDNIVGKEFNYEGQKIKIDNYKCIGGSNVIVYMNERPRNFLVNEIPTFLENLFEVLDESLKENQIAIPSSTLKVYEPTAENTEVKATLLETLSKVKSDPKYIPQAEAICGVVSQIVSVQKTEIQMLTLLSKKKNG